MDTNTLGTLVWQLSTRWRSAIDRTLAPLGLTHAQYTALNTLAAMRDRGDTPSQRALAKRMGVSAIFASRLLRALESEGYIQRTDHPQDTRAFSLALSPTGHAQLANARVAVKALEESLTAPVGDLGGNAAQALRIMLKALLASPDAEATLRHAGRVGAPRRRTPTQPTQSDGRPLGGP